MPERGTPAIFVGQVERDARGRLWAVLYTGDRVLTREEVVSIRHGRRRVTDMVLAAADTAPQPAAIRDKVSGAASNVDGTPAPRVAGPLHRNPWRPAPLG